MGFEMFNSEAFCGYTQITTAYLDLSIAETIGGNKKAIKETYNSLFNNFKNSYKELTELVMVLNWKLWGWYEKGNEEYAKLYDELWRKADDYAIEHLKGEELSYFYATTD